MLDRKLATTALVFMILVCSAPRLYAQDDAKQKMGDLMTQGAKLFQQKKFADAAVKFGEAYDAFPDPNLKKNEMVAWFKANNCGKALPAAEVFLRDGNDITRQDRSDVAKVRTRCDIRTAKAKLELGDLDAAESALQRARRGAPGSSDRETISELQTQIDARRDEQSHDHTNPPPPEPPPGSPDRPTWAAFTGGGLLVASAAGWGYFAYLQRDGAHLSDRFDAQCVRTGDEVRGMNPANDQSCKDLYRSVSTAVTLQWPVAIGAGLTAIGGVGLLTYYLLGSESDTQTSRLVPMVGPGGAGMAFELPLP